MSKIKLSLPVIVLVLLSLYKTSSAQFEINPIYYYAFDRDSLVGFDENAARASAISERFLGSEFKIRMYRLKREYINNKYSLIHTSPIMYDINTYLDNNRPAAQPGCVNEDFEASTAGVITASTQISGWTVTGGLNNPYLPTSPSAAGYSSYFPNGLPGVTSCNLLGCCPMPPSHSELIDCSAAGGYYDAIIGSQYHIYSVFGTGTVSGAVAANTQIAQGLFGNKVLRLNDELTGDYSIEKLSKTFAVTSNNALFQFAFISVFAPGHACCDAGGFQIRLSNASANTVIPCPNFSVSAPSSNCTGTVPVTYYNCGDGSVYDPNVNYGNIYHPWKINSMDLTSYIGQNITIDIIISDCNAGGHFGCIYFDAQCGPMTVYGNGNAYDAGLNVTVPTCGAAGATICAADGLGPYSWSGPGLSPSQSIPSMTNQCITATVSSQFTLSMQPAGSCAPITRIVNSTITPAPLLNASVLQAQCGSSLAIVSVTPSGSAANPSSLTWSPTPLSLNSGTTQGTYTVLPVGGAPILVSITASDPLGCKITTTINVNPAPPTPTFSILNNTGSPSITCTYPSIDLATASTYSYNSGSLNYFWASASATFVTNTITAINPGTYTVTGTDLATNCHTTNLITIGINTVTPLSVISPLMQNITCNLTTVTGVTVTANPTVNITQQILAPQGGTFSSTSYTALYVPGGIGTFTYILVNDINGCFSSKNFTVASNQGFPTFNVTSPQNFSLGCSSRSCAIINIVNGNTSLPQGGPVSYTVIPPSSSSVTPTGALSGNSTYTVCTPGTYTVITKDNTSFCETRVPISILENTVTPNFTTTFERQILDCDHPKVTLKGSSTNPNVDYSWMFIGTPNTQQGDTITALALPNSTAVTTVNSFTFVVRDLSSECVSYTTIPIYQNFFTPYPLITQSTHSVTCITPTIVLTNGSSTGISPSSGYPANLPVIAFLWEGPSPQEPLSNSTTYTAAAVGIYTVTAKDLNNGCTATATTQIIDNRNYPIVQQPTVSPVVLDCGHNSVKITPYYVGITTDYDYTWTTPAASVNGTNTAQTIDAGAVGEYAVHVYNRVNGCASDLPITVLNGTLTADFDADQSTGFAPLTVNFTNNSSSTTGTTNINSVWNFGNGTTSTFTNVQSSSVLFTQPGTYTITLFATKGACMDSKQKVVRLDIPSVLEIPNVFTPNGDGANDLFFFKSTNLTEIRAEIFDRWGHKVYEINSTTGNIEWDGKNLQGKEAATGVYFYTIKATGKDNAAFDKKGTISLFR